VFRGRKGDEGGEGVGSVSVGGRVGMQRLNLLDKETVVSLDEVAR